MRKSIENLAGRKYTGGKKINLIQEENIRLTDIQTNQYKEPKILFQEMLEEIILNKLLKVQNMQILAIPKIEKL